MKLRSILEIELAEINFYSQYDEETFFGWLKKLRCVENVRGQGLILYVQIETDLMDEGELRDLIALFIRYKINKKQLAKFDRPEFSIWFRNERADWYDEIFG